MSRTSIPEWRLIEAESLLHGFDTRDKESHDFFRSIIASQHVPLDALTELRNVSLMRGMEDWDMLFACAASIRLKIYSHFGHDPTLLSCLAIVLSGRVGALYQSLALSKGTTTGTEKRREQANLSRKRQPPKSVSPFFTEPDVRQAGESNREVSVNISQPEALSSNLVGPKKRKRHHSVAEDNASSSNGHLSAATPYFGFGSQGGAQGQRVLEHSPELLLETGETSEALRDEAKTTTTKRSSRSKQQAKSHFFGSSPIDTKETLKERRIISDAGNISSPSPAKKRPRPARGTVSGLPFPPLSQPRFGLVQERLAHDPYRLLIAVTFLIRTPGKVAVPVFEEVMRKFPTPEDLAAADPAEIVPMIRHLGLSVVRCAAIQKYARIWSERPPSREVRFGVKNYPAQGDGRGVKLGEMFGPEDAAGPAVEDAGAGSEEEAVSERQRRALGSAWEIGHLTQGKYAIDSWRIFCRDELLGRAEDWLGTGRGPDFQPEWMRVLPTDKELRAYLRWMWMQEGWDWDPLTGEKEVLSEELRAAVNAGRVEWDNTGKLIIMDQPRGEAE